MKMILWVDREQCGSDGERVKYRGNEKIELYKFCAHEHGQQPI
jgi:hypothetical protein